MMQIYKVFVLLFIVFTLFLSASANCVIYNDPRYSGLFVSCLHSDLNHVPDLPFNTTSVDLSFNSFSVIHNGSFSNTTYLKYLDLSHNVLTHLEPEAFQNCHLLQHLDLSDNKLALTSESFPDVVFDPLFDLRWLNIKDNQKGDGTYPERIFQNLRNLSVLSIGAYKDQIFGVGFGYLHSLRELNIGGDNCEFKEIQNNTFAEFAKTALDKLEIDFCFTEFMEPGSLAPLKLLTDLTLSFLHLGTKHTIKALSPLSGRQMKKIQLRRVRLRDTFSTVGKTVLEDQIIAHESLKYLEKICVENFELAQNDILWIDLFSLAETSFANCIEFIDLSSNRITSDESNLLLALASFPKIRIINISIPIIDVNLNIKPRYDKEIKASRPMYYSNPCIKIMCNISVPHNLSVINLSGITRNYGTIYGMYNILNGEHIVQFNISFCGITNLNAMINGLENMKVIDISGNTYLNFENFNIISNFPKLEELRLSFSSFQQKALIETGRGLLKTLPQIKRLYLAYNQLYLLPNNLFDFSSNLDYLDLSGNFFTSMPFDLSLLPQLQTLDVSFNAITSLKKWDRATIDAHSSNSFRLKLKNNLLACGCDSVDFLLWLKETNVHLDNNRNYSCLEGSEGIINTEDILEDFLKTWRNCNGRNSFYITLVILTLILASILGSLLVKTNKTSIIYIFLNNLKTQLRKPKREDFEYDVYVAYAEKDYQWICLSLCPRLEEMGLRLYICDRDAVPGDSIPDQIAENISRSWKIILYFSNNYETDQWSYMSMMAAINSVDNLSPEKIILLLPEEEHPRLPMCLLEVVPESCIFHVPTDCETHGVMFRSLVDLVMT